MIELVPATESKVPAIITYRLNGKWWTFQNAAMLKRMWEWGERDRKGKDDVKCS